MNNEGRATVAGQAPCPNCGATLEPDSILCIQCGFHYKLGKQISTGSLKIESSNDNTSQFNNNLLSFIWIDGRSNRATWWLIQFSFVIVWFVTGVAAQVFNLPDALVLMPFFLGFWIALVSQIRRWHDLDKSGLWCFVNFIPIIGWLYAIVELGFQEGTDGYNQYGDEPCVPFQSILRQRK